MCTLFLSHNQSFQRKMTLCDLLHKTTWPDIKPYIERHLNESSRMELSDYEQMFERLRCMAPERWIVPGVFRFYVSPDTPYCGKWKDIAHDTISATGYYVTDHAFGVPWAVALATRIEQLGDLHLSDAEWAAYCLWEMSREKIEREIPLSMHCFRNKNKPHFFRRFGWLRTDYRIKHLYKRLSTPVPLMDSDKAKLRKQLQRIEAAIFRITGKDMDRLLVKRISEKKRERIGDLIGQRKMLLDRMFAATPEEVERMEQVNTLLLQLTQQMYHRSAELYRKVLGATYDKTFDDDVVVEGSLKYNCDGPESVLHLSNDRYYGSDFTRMLQIIDWLYFCRTDGFILEEIESTLLKSIEPDDSPSMSDAELGFTDDLDDGNTWAEACLDHPAFKYICICHAVHDICTHKSYSIPDLLHMNDFWCEVKIIHQHIVDQSGSRWKWWKHCSFEELRDKLCTEAAHRPEQLRLGQYIMARTSQLFPDTVHPTLWGGADDCFNDDDRIDAYLYRLYDTLQKQIES